MILNPYPILCYIDHMKVNCHLPYLITDKKELNRWPTKKFSLLMTVESSEDV